MSLYKDPSLQGPYLDLGPGDILQEGDLYWSTSGQWEAVTFVGLEIQKDSGGQFIRPIHEES